MRGSAVLAGLRVWVPSPILLAVPVVCLVSLASVVLLVASGPATWERVLAHQNMWIVAVGPGFVGAVAAYIAVTERRAGPAVNVRSVAPWRRTLAGSCVLGWWMLVFCSTHVGTAFLAYAVIGERTAGLGEAFRDTATLAWVCVLGGTAFVVLVRLVGEATGFGGALVATLLLVVAGATTAETRLWPFVPSAWQIRPTLSLIGTHANGEALNGVVISGSVVAVALSLISGTALVLARAGVSARSDSRMRRMPSGGRVVETSLGAAASGGPTARPRRGSLGILDRMPAAALRGSGLLVLTALAIVTVGWLRRYLEPGETATVFALLVLPLGCSVLPLIAVSRWRRGARGIAIRPVSVRKHARRLIAAESLVLTSAVAGSVFVIGPGFVVGLRIGVVFVVFGMMLLAFGTFLTSSVGLLPTLLVAVAGTIAGVLVGGNDGLRSAFGMYVPWAWAGNLDTGALIVTIPVALTAAAVFTALSVRSLASSTSAMK
ncbi:hypothetical protein [Rhodococcus rhodnii]|uniref:hypothetical protein n=1 Tax=Rhodococcus rhodnii TaxID=38312 RepID=UPI0011601455|nr:hypothetical protein [Rhodococcus rhodnii]